LVELDLMLLQNFLNQEAHGHSSLRERLKPLPRRRLLRIFTAHLAQSIGLQAADLLIDQRTWSCDFVRLYQGIERSRLGLRADPLRELAFHVLPHFAAQQSGTTRQTEAGRECVVELREQLLLDTLHVN